MNVTRTAERWRDFLGRTAATGPMPSVIVESWSRSEAAGVDCSRAGLRFHRVAEEDLRHRLEENADWLAIARPHLEWLSTTLGHVPHVVYVTDRDGIVLHCVGDATLIEQFGLAPGHDWSEARMGTNGAGTALAADRPVAVVGRQHYNAAFDNCTCLAAPLHAPDGTLIGAIDVSTSVADGVPESLCMVAHTAYAIGRELAYERQEAQLRRTEQSLREREQQLREILDNTPAIVYIVDAQDRFLFINRRWEAVFGLTNEMVANRPVSDFFPREAADQFHKNNRATFDARKPVEFEEVVTQNDRLHTYLTIKVPLYNSDRPHAICGISTDITKRKQLESDLLLADQRKDRMLATVAHELRNPLAPILMGLQLMKMSAGDPDIFEETLSTMEQQAEQMVRLIDDLLDVARITQGNLQLRKKPTDVRDVLRTAVDASRPLLETGGHKLSIDVPERACMLDADPDRLAQVFVNLLNNANKYTPSGGRIWLSAQQDASHVTVAVRDTGIGIPQEMQSRIFEMFMQVDRPMENGCAGLGIGLSLVRQLVAMHDGSIEVRSDGHGKGSEFIVRLPLLSENGP